MNKIVLITGWAGYVGSALVPSLLDSGYKVVVYDLYLFGNVFKEIKNKNLTEIKGDIRDKGKLLEAGKGVDYLIHLACISNDPSFELDPKLGKSINYDAFQNVIETVKSNNIKRIIFASSASIYEIQITLRRSFKGFWIKKLCFREARNREWLCAASTPGFNHQQFYN